MTFGFAGRVLAPSILAPRLPLALPAAVQAEGFTYTTNDGAVTITGYAGTNTDMIVPSAINGLPVASIRIPASVTRIGQPARLWRIVPVP